jgi:hypothetical protein
MKTVEQIIQRFGGLEFLRRDYIRLEVEGFMPLCIEYIGEGPRGLPLISVCHYGEQNGDAMRDPDVVFEVDFATGAGWGPISFRNDYLGIYQEAVFTDEDGRVMIRQGLVKDLKAFARMWDKNLRDQGFLDAARKVAAAR